MTSELKSGISGYLPVRNCIALDYHFEECIRSLLPVCDEVVVCDSDSTDGTTEAVLELTTREPKVRLINWPFTNPNGDYFWHDRWMNFARGHLRYDMALAMDADHVIGPESYDLIRECAGRKECRWFNYVYFWGDAQHTVPWGDSRNVHLSPTQFWWPVQNQVPADEVNIRALALGPHPDMTVYSYSTLRKRQAFFDKCRAYGRYIMGDEGATDSALEQSERTGAPVTQFYPDKQISVFAGKHPPVMEKWLTERGWKIA